MRIAHWIVLLFVACLVSCSRPVRNTVGGPVQRYQLHGQIVQVDAKAHAALIKHQKIEGWMEAMTMEFPVKDEREFQALHAGDQITATVFVQDTDYWIGEIHHEIIREERK